MERGPFMERDYPYYHEDFQPRAFREQFYQAPTKEEELEHLKLISQELEDELKAIRERIGKMEEEK